MISSLSSIEKQVLLKKYVTLGNTFEEAKEKINSFCEYLKLLKARLRLKGMPEQDINLRFKKEFEALCQRLDGGQKYINKFKEGGKRSPQTIKRYLENLKRKGKLIIEK